MSRRPALREITLFISTDNRESGDGDYTLQKCGYNFSPLPMLWADYTAGTLTNFDANRATTSNWRSRMTATTAGGPSQVPPRFFLSASRRRTYSELTCRRSKWPANIGCP
jgi:hypothetical protein